jgi:hypothetical protein
MTAGSCGPCRLVVVPRPRLAGSAGQGRQRAACGRPLKHLPCLAPLRSGRKKGSRPRFGRLPTPTRCDLMPEEEGALTPSSETERDANAS